MPLSNVHPTARPKRIKRKNPLTSMSLPRCCFPKCHCFDPDHETPALRTLVFQLSSDTFFLGLPFLVKPEGTRNRPLSVLLYSSGAWGVLPDGRVEQRFWKGQGLCWHECVSDGSCFPKEIPPCLLGRWTLMTRLSRFLFFLPMNG